MEKFRVVAESPSLPVPVGVRIMLPLYGPFGVTVKLEDALPAFPLPGPANMYVEATHELVVKVWSGVEVPVPTELVAKAIK